MLLDSAAREVLARYPAPWCNGTLVPLGNRGGFSGASLWRVEVTCAACLRAWPVDGPALKALARIHGLVIRARRQGVEFLPEPFATRDGTTTPVHAGRLWDMMAWMPGVADFHARPSTARLEAACVALARLHRAWGEAASPPTPCPAVKRRLEAHQRWHTRCAAGWRPEPRPDDPLRSLVECAQATLDQQLHRIPDRLAFWVGRPVPVQPCLCDVWHDHVLFDGDAVTGLIDFGSVRDDNISADLARMLGSLVGDDVPLRRAGLAAYRRVRTLSAEEEALVDVLDETGALIGIANWLTWLYADGRKFADHHSVASRLGELVQRIERWKRT